MLALPENENTERKWGRDSIISSNVSVSSSSPVPLHPLPVVLCRSYVAITGPCPPALVLRLQPQSWQATLGYSALEPLLGVIAALGFAVMALLGMGRFAGDDGGFACFSLIGACVKCVCGLALSGRHFCLLAVRFGAKEHRPTAQQNTTCE